MKIILVNKYFFFESGAARSFFDMKEMLEAAGHEVIPFSVKDPRNLPTPYAKYFVSSSKFRYRGPFVSLFTEPLNALKGFFTMLYSFEAKKNFALLLDEVQPDVVHIHNIYHHISPSILHAAHTRGIPIVQTVHDYKLICPNYKLFSHGHVDESCKNKRFLHDAFNRSIQHSFIKGLVCALEMYLHSWMGIYTKTIAHWIVPSVFVKNKLVENGFPSERIQVLPHCLPTTIPIMGERKKNTVLYVGRLSEEKGIPILIQALTLCPDVTLRVVGEGPEREFLENYAKECGVSERTLFIGKLDKGQVEVELATVQALIVPSVWYEVFGYVVIEAWASKTPVIASQIGALSELLEQVSPDLLFKAGDARELAHAIRRVVDSPLLRDTVGESGRRFVEKSFDCKDFYTQLMFVYSSLDSR